jgi:hypothetical protein
MTKQKPNKKNFPKPNKELIRIRKNHRKLKRLNRKASLKLCKEAPDNNSKNPCVNCIESKCLVPNGIPKASDYNRCYYPRSFEIEQEERREKERERKAKEYENKHKGKTGIQMINEYLNEVLKKR